MPVRDVAQILEHQLQDAFGFARQALAGLTDGEYFWEPVVGCWSVRRNDGDNPPELGGLLGVADGEARPNLRPWFCEHGWFGQVRHRPTGWTPVIARL